MLAFLKKMNFESLEEKEFLKVLSGKLMMVPPATLQKFKMFDDLGPISENDSMEIKQFKSIFSSSRWQLAESADVVGDGDVLNDQSKSMRQKVIINSPRDSQNDLISSSQVGEIFFAKVPKGCQPDWSQVKNHNDVSDVILRYNLKDASDPLVREVLVKLTFKLCELRFVKNIQPDFVNKVMFGLRNMSDDVPEVRHLLSVLQPTFQSLMGSLSAHQLCMAIYGLRRMTGNTKEADAILSVFNSFAPNINKLFGWYVVRALEGLHGLVSSGSSKAIKLMQYLLDRSVRDKVTFNAASIGDCMCDLVDCDPIGTNFITDKLLPDLAVFENYVASGKTVNMEEIWTLIQRLELVQYKINAGVPLSATKDLPIVTLISSLLSKFRSHAEKSSQLPIIKITPQILKVANLLSLALADRRGVKVSHHKYIYLFPCDIIIQQYANDEKSPSLSVNIELFRAVDEKRSVQKLRDNYLESLHNVVVLRLDKQFLSSLTRENIVSSVRQRLVKDLETSDRSLDLKKIVENIFADTLLPVGKIPWPNLLQQGNNEKRKWRPKMPT